MPGQDGTAQRTAHGREPGPGGAPAPGCEPGPVGGAAGPREDTRGIVESPGLLARVRFRRRLPAEPLRRWVEHYWLIDWDLDQPYASHVVPHPTVNVVFEQRESGMNGPETVRGLVAGVGLRLFSTKLEGVGRVCGVQFRPGGFRPFLDPPYALSSLAGKQLPFDEVFPGVHDAPGVPFRVLSPTLSPAHEDDGVAALDALLLSLRPAPDPLADQVMALAHRARTDRAVLRVEELAALGGLSVRTLQRLFATYVGVGPKWVILRYRVHEAVERATGAPATDWARLAAELGYSDQAHLVRDFTAAVGVSPTAYTKAVAASTDPG